MQGIERTCVEMSDNPRFCAIESQMPPRRCQQDVTLPDFSTFLSFGHVQRTQVVQPLCIKFDIPDRHVHHDGDRQGEIRRETRNEILQRLWPPGRNPDQNNVQRVFGFRFRVGRNCCWSGFSGTETHISCSFDFFNQLVGHLKYFFRGQSRRFLNEVNCPGVERIEYQLVSLTCNAYDNSRYRASGHQFANKSQTTHSGHDQVDCYHIRMQFLDQRQTLFAIPRRTHYIYKWASAEHLLDHFANVCRVVHNQNTQHTIRHEARPFMYTNASPISSKLYFVVNFSSDSAAPRNRYPGWGIHSSYTFTIFRIAASVK